MKLHFNKKKGSTRLYLFYVAFGLFRKWSRFRNAFFRFSFLLPNFEKMIRDINIISELRALLPDFSRFKSEINEIDKKRILQNADKILSNRFQVFAKSVVEANPIPWQLDVSSGFAWPKGKYYADYVQVDLTNNADVKYPRELSRSHFLLYLGQAYLLSNDECYARKYVEIIENWLKENPFMHSINWGCTMDVAIRAVNWAYAFAMVADAKSISDRFEKEFTKSLYQHAWFIYRNQEINYYNNANHYDSNIASLLFFGMLFKKTKEGDKWFDHAKEEFYFELRQQVLPSGVVYEKSINYGRLVAEIFTFCYCLLRNVHEDIPLDIHLRIEKQFDFMSSYIKTDGLAPVIGDQDDARWLPFSPVDNLDHKHLLSLAALLFNRSDFKALANGYSADAFFLVKDKSKTDFMNIADVNVSRQSVAFKDAGFFIMKSEQVYLFINNGGISKYQENIGNEVYGSHTHADLLSFELARKQRTFLVDPGTWVYTSDPHERNRFRSTAMHNTVCVDGIDQMIIPDDNLFVFHSAIHPKLRQWISNADFDTFEGEHDGFARLSDPVIHRRKITLNKKNEEIIISDWLFGKEMHDVDIYFHFDAGVDFKIANKNTVVTCLENEPNLAIIFDENKKLTLAKLESWVSKQYGHQERSQSLKCSFSELQLPFAFKTSIRFLVE